MLRFIKELLAIKLIANIFQYISCYGLSRCCCLSDSPFGISIHLMLRFIAYLASVCASSTSFQYISCYGLSSKHYRKCHKISYFNTSHVTVYRGTHSVDFGLCIRFQYISCYGLSPHSVSLFGTIQAISIHLMLRFITVESP